MRSSLVLAAAVATLAVVVVSAAAKFRMTLTLSDRTPTTGQLIRVTLRTDLSREEARAATMRLLSVPPGTFVDQVLDRERPYRMRLTRTESTWRASIRFPRPGHWKLVVPNWGAPGYALPPPIVREVVVTRP